jgi:Family of unknown function (DUF6166)
VTVYKAMRIFGDCKVWKQEADGHDTLLPPRNEVRNHSPDGFNWGYGGSGPAQLALALLLDVVDRYIAEALYQEFKWKVISLKTADIWVITQGQIQQWVDRALIDNPTFMQRAKALEEVDRLCETYEEGSSPGPTQPATD